MIKYDGGQVSPGPILNSGTYRLKVVKVDENEDRLLILTSDAKWGTHAVYFWKVKATKQFHERTIDDILSLALACGVIRQGDPTEFNPTTFMNKEFIGTLRWSRVSERNPESYLNIIKAEHIENASLHNFGPDTNRKPDSYRGPESIVPEGETLPM